MAVSGPKGTQGEIYNCPAGVSVLDVVYISNPNEVDQAVANDNAKKFAIGIVTEKPSPTVARVLTVGKVLGFSGLTAGTPVFLSDSVAGGLTQTPPSGSGKWLQILGMATDVNGLSLQVNPPIARI